MNNNDGALSFDAYIKDTDFKRQLDEMQARIVGFSDKAVSETDKMDSAFRKLGAAVGTYLSFQALKDFGQEIINVRGDFQQLEIAFTTMLGSKQKANELMAQLTKTAATTPFDLQGIASGAKQLLAYGTEAKDVNDTLVRLGNIASGLSIPLSDMVYLYGTTQTQGRLYTQDLNQFLGRGIPLVKELAKQFGVSEDQVKGLVTEGKVGFPQVQKAIVDLTSKGGMFYNLMEEQSKSLKGQISNLGDAWDGMLNQIGKSNEGFISGAFRLSPD
jgi:tape measure domain-containing protein